MVFMMCFEATVLGEFLAADLAEVRHFLRVEHGVLIAVPFLPEGLAADLALIGFIFSVDCTVRLEIAV